jgi:hypothetical protein
VRLIVRPEAEADMAEGYAWYESQQTGLGELSEISFRLSEIEREPLRFQRVRDEARRALLRRLPYAVFFIQGPDYISVIAAMHMARDPAVWQKRADRDL